MRATGRRSRAVVAAALVLTLAACGGDEGTTAETATVSSAAPSTSAAGSPSTSPTGTPEVAAAPDACELLDLAALEQAGLRPDRPAASSLTSADGADVATALGGRDALLTCDAGFTASAQVNDMADEASAQEEARRALDTAADTPTAVRTDLPGTLVPFGATVVDPELQSASVQFQLRDLHVAIVLGYGEAGDLAVAEVEALLRHQLERALTALD